MSRHGARCEEGVYMGKGSETLRATSLHPRLEGQEVGLTKEPQATRVDMRTGLALREAETCASRIELPDHPRVHPNRLGRAPHDRPTCVALKQSNYVGCWAAACLLHRPPVCRDRPGHAENTTVGRASR